MLKAMNPYLTTSPQNMLTHLGRDGILSLGDKIECGAESISPLEIQYGWNSRETASRLDIMG
jgi:hypothetical protein